MYNSLVIRKMVIKIQHFEQKSLKMGFGDTNIIVIMVVFGGIILKLLVLTKPPLDSRINHAAESLPLLLKIYNIRYVRDDENAVRKVWSKKNC